MVSAYAENHGTSETMEKTQSIVRSAAQRLRELLPKATGWEEHAGLKVGGQKADLVMKFKFGGDEQTLLLEITSLGQPHNVVKRLVELAWLDRGEQQRIHLSKPADLLDAWVDAYTYRLNEATTYFSPERITRKLVGEIARVAQEEGRRFVFTLHSGA